MAELAHLPVAVPDLAAVVADPALLGRLPVDVLVALRAQLRHLDVEIGLAVDRMRLQPTQDRLLPDRAVGIDEACQLLGMERGYLERRRNWEQLGGYKDTDQHVKFRMSDLQRRLRGRR